MNITFKNIQFNEIRKNIKLQDFPSASVPTKIHGNKLKQVERDGKFLLMLTAIEEHSGNIIVLKTIEWEKSISLQYDCTRLVYSRFKLKDLNTSCKLKQSNFLDLKKRCHKL